jgi:hypothetical protein
VEDRDRERSRHERGEDREEREQWTKRTDEEGVVSLVKICLASPEDQPTGIEGRLAKDFIFLDSPHTPSSFISRIAFF